MESSIAMEQAFSQTPADRMETLRKALRDARNLSILYGLKTTDHLGCAMQVYSHLDANLQQQLNVYLNDQGCVKFWDKDIMIEKRLFAIMIVPLVMRRQLRRFFADLCHKADSLHSDEKLTEDKGLALLSEILAMFVTVPHSD